MKLEFEDSIIPEHPFRELGFQDYLSLFESELPMIPFHILRPLKAPSAVEHYRRLTELDQQLTKHRVDLEAILQQCQQLPAIDYLLRFFEQQQLESYHLFDLGRFAHEAVSLERLERRFPLSVTSNVCNQILSILATTLSADFGSLLLEPSEQALLNTINSLGEQINQKLEFLEQEVLKQTGLKVIHAIPKDISKTEKNVKSIQDSHHLILTDNGETFRVELVPDDELNKLQEQKTNLNRSWQQAISSKLKTLNQKLKPYCIPFTEYCQTRKRRVLDYLLITGKQRNNLCFPQFVADLSLKMDQGILPVLKKQQGENYNPLKLQLNSGLNILFGANLTGKTTVLKTLFFHLNLVKFGLPVPAKTLIMGIPEHFSLLLKSSGDIHSGLSGFGEELAFFSTVDDAPAVYLVDELFHSTDPINGVKLTQAFLSGLSTFNALFLFTSHYPEIIEFPGINLFRMKDIEAPTNIDCDVEKLLKQVPYEVEVVSADDLKKTLKDSTKPLQIALRFPLPEAVKQHLRKMLEN